MKQTKLTLFLLAFVIMLTTLSAVIPNNGAKPVKKQVNYYWFDSNSSWLGRQNTLANEMNLTGFNESTSNPKTLQEKGWAPANCSVDGFGIPHPLTSTPDKALYSHP
jgi:hypothetical protein